jgi:hypothetical protein
MDAPQGILTSYGPQHDDFSLISFACCALLSAQISFSVRHADDSNFETVKKSAEQGDAEAQIKLAGAYFKGEGVAKDYQQAAEWIVEAVNWYRKSGEEDFVEAELELGRLFYFGDTGIAQNYPEARKWLTKAAEHGKAWAQNTLGVIYLSGYGVERDPKQSFGWFQRAAELGNAKAHSNVGQMYAEGTGVENDLVKAYQWPPALRLRASAVNPARTFAFYLFPSAFPRHLRSDDIDVDISRRALLSFRMPKTSSNRQTAKLFVNGRSQVVRLPAEFRFEGKEVFIR